jgi:tetratricopeptide (TPR) repeat protein
MVLVRFGMWDELLQLPFRDDPQVHKLHTLFLRFGRGVAYGAKGDVASAKAEQTAFLELFATMDDRTKHNVDGRDMAAIAADVLAGEVMYREGRYTEAFAVLREGIAKSDGLPYDEPQGWMMSVRQTLGALLSEQGHYEEACTVYTEDLDEFPNNVSLMTKCHPRWGGGCVSNLFRAKTCYFVPFPNLCTACRPHARIC